MERPLLAQGSSWAAPELGGPFRSILPPSSPSACCKLLFHLVKSSLTSGSSLSQLLLLMSHLCARPPHATPPTWALSLVLSSCHFELSQLP